MASGIFSTTDQDTQQQDAPPVGVAAAGVSAQTMSSARASAATAPPSPIFSGEPTSTPPAAKAGGQGYATVFGLNPDGSVDKADNGVGAFGANTRDPSLRGVSLPESALIAQFGSTAAAKGQMVSVTNPATGKTSRLPIVDIGPGESTGNALDLTYGAMKDLGGTGKDKMSYAFDGPGVDKPGAPGYTSPPSNPAAASGDPLSKPVGMTDWGGLTPILSGGGQGPQTEAPTPVGTAAAAAADKQKATSLGIIAALTQGHTQPNWQAQRAAALAMMPHSS